MSGLPWFKCEPRRFREGLIGLTPEERGAYTTVIMLIYERVGPIPDEAKWIASHLNVSEKTWGKLRAALIVGGRIREIVVDGRTCLTDDRCEKVLSEQASLRDRFSAGGKQSRKSGASAKENNDLDLAPLEGALNPPASGLHKIEEERQEIDSSPNGEVSLSAEIDLTKAFEAWNLMAKAHGLPVARACTGKRLVALKARLRDVGLAGWLRAVEAVPKTPFLMGENKSGWRADLDFLTQPLSLQRVLEGSYERAPDDPNRSRSRWSLDHERKASNYVEGTLEFVDRGRR
jgi:hypothetical protein